MSVQTLFSPNDYTIYAETGIFDNLIFKNVSGGSFTASGDIVADNITILNSFTAPGASITPSGQTIINFLVAETAIIPSLDTNSGTIQNFTSISGSITNLEVVNLSAANIISNQIISYSGTFTQLMTNGEIVRNLSGLSINSISGFITNFGSTNSIITTLSDSNINSISGFITNFGSTNSIITTLSSQSINSISGSITNLLVTNVDGLPYPTQALFTISCVSGSFLNTSVPPAVTIPTGSGYVTQWGNLITGFFNLSGVNVTTGSVPTQFSINYPGALGLSGTPSRPIGSAATHNFSNSTSAGAGTIFGDTNYMTATYVSGPADTGNSTNVYGSFSYLA